MEGFLQKISLKHWIFIFALTGLVLRILVIPNPGFEADISFWKSWGLATLDLGIVKAAHETNNNYPTPFSYTLGAVVWIYSLFADPHNFYEFWTNTNTLFLAIAKSLPIIADFGLAFLILFIGKNTVKLGFPSVPFSVYVIASGLYLLNPVAILDGAWWGQVDSVGVFLLLLAVTCALLKYPLIAGVIYMIAVMTKLQNMIYGPLFFLFLWQLYGLKGLVRGTLGSFTAFFALNIEFFLARDMARVIASLTENYDYFPLISLNAYNVWWIVSGAKGMEMSDKYLMVGLLNAKRVGLFAFSSFYLMAILIMIYTQVKRIFHKTQTSRKNIQTNQFTDPIDKTRVIRNFILALILTNSAFFLFQTQSHDRYAFPLTIFLLLFIPFLSVQYQKNLPWYRNRVMSWFLASYALFTIVYFYNLHTALIINYPHNGLPLISTMTAPFFTLGTSLIHIVLFLTFLLLVLKNIQPLVFLVPLSIFLIMVIFGNIPLWTKKPISLTKFTPIVSQQSYGNRMVNMPVNASLGFNHWSPLSVQYAFYHQGFGIHANSMMNFDIGGHFKKLSIDYGIDTEAGINASSVFVIYGDGRKLFTSERMGRFDMPRHIEVDVTNVKILGLVTTDGGDSINDDHTDWLNPLLWP